MDDARSAGHVRVQARPRLLDRGKKAEAGRVSPSQVERHIELRLCDIPVHVVTSLEELQAALERKP